LISNRIAMNKSVHIKEGYIGNYHQMNDIFLIIC